MIITSIIVLCTQRTILIRDVNQQETYVQEGVMEPASGHLSLLYGAADGGEDVCVHSN